MDKKIEITRTEMAQAVTDVIASKRIMELTQASPVLLLAFTVFGLELTRTLFEEKNEEEQK